MKLRSFSALFTLSKNVGNFGADVEFLGDAVLTFKPKKVHNSNAVFLISLPEFSAYSHLCNNINVHKCFPGYSCSVQPLFNCSLGSFP